MDKKEEIIERMRKILSGELDPDQIQETSISINDEFSITDEERNWLSSEPVPDDTIIINLIIKNERLVVCLREIGWYEFQEIECASYRRTKSAEEEINYYSGEYESREVLRNSLIWVANIDSQEIIKENVLSYLNSEIVSKIWERYYPLLVITAKEANALYSAAISYFRGDTGKKPIPALIIEVDMLIKMGSLSRSEIRQIKASEMQRIKLILKARSEALQLSESESESRASQFMGRTIVPPEFEQLPGFLPSSEFKK